MQIPLHLLVGPNVSIEFRNAIAPDEFCDCGANVTKDEPCKPTCPLNGVGICELCDQPKEEGRTRSLICQRCADALTAEPNDPTDYDAAGKYAD